MVLGGQWVSIGTTADILGSMMPSATDKDLSKHVRGTNPRFTVLDEAADLPSEPEPELTMWVIYERPLDYPDSYVLRRWRVMPGKVEPEPEPTAVGPLGYIRKQLPADLTCMGRNPNDDPKILETWF